LFFFFLSTKRRKGERRGKKRRTEGSPINLGSKKREENKRGHGCLGELQDRSSAHAVTVKQKKEKGEKRTGNDISVDYIFSPFRPDGEKDGWEKRKKEGEKKEEWSGLRTFFICRGKGERERKRGKGEGEGWGSGCRNLAVLKLFLFLAEKKIKRGEKRGGGIPAAWTTFTCTFWTLVFTGSGEGEKGKKTKEKRKEGKWKRGREIPGHRWLECTLIILIS